MGSGSDGSGCRVSGGEDGGQQPGRQHVNMAHHPARPPASIQRSSWPAWDPNDILACGGNVDCAADDIRGFIDTAGPDHEVWWALQTAQSYLTARRLEPGPADRRGRAPEPDPVGLADHPRRQRHPDGRDNTHLPGPPYRRRSALIADDVTARLAGRTRRPEVLRRLRPVVPYRPAYPVRLIDTRDNRCTHRRRAAP